MFEPPLIMSVGHHATTTPTPKDRLHTLLPPMCEFQRAAASLCYFMDASRLYPSSSVSSDGTTAHITPPPYALPGYTLSGPSRPGESTSLTSICVPAVGRPLVHSPPSSYSSHSSLSSCSSHSSLSSLANPPFAFSSPQSSSRLPSLRSLSVGTDPVVTHDSGYSYTAKSQVSPSPCERALLALSLQTILNGGVPTPALPNPEPPRVSLAPPLRLLPLHTATHLNHQPSTRRQRLGPSCDSCRLRKVKCNAEIHLLLPQETAALPAALLKQVSLGPDLKFKVIGGFPGTDDFLLIQVYVPEAPNRFVKFKACRACATKHLECAFSQGYTRSECRSDPLGKPCSRTPPTTVTGHSPTIPSYRVSKVATTPTTTLVQQLAFLSAPRVLEGLAVRPAGDSATTVRKASCVLCRKRKVKCEFSNGTACTNCTKRHRECKLENARRIS